MTRLFIASSLVIILLLRLVEGDSHRTDSKESCEKLDIVLKHPNCFSQAKWKLKAKIFCQISVQSDSSQTFWLKKNHAEQEIFTLTQPCRFGGSGFGFKKASFWCCFGARDQSITLTTVKKTIPSSNKSVPKLLMRSTIDDGDQDGVSVINHRTISQLTKHSSTDSPEKHTAQKQHLPTQKISTTTEYISPLSKTSPGLTKHEKECDLARVIGLYKSMIPKHKGLCEFYASYLEDFSDTENWHSSSIDLLKEQLKVGKSRYLILKAKNETLAQSRLNRKSVIHILFKISNI